MPAGACAGVTTHRQYTREEQNDGFTWNTFHVKHLLSTEPRLQGGPANTQVDRRLHTLSAQLNADDPGDLEIGRDREVAPRGHCARASAGLLKAHAIGGRRQEPVELGEARRARSSRALRGGEAEVDPVQRRPPNLERSCNGA